MTTYDLGYIIFDGNSNGGIWINLNKIEIYINGSSHLSYIDMSTLNKRLKGIDQRYIKLKSPNKLSFRLMELY